MKIVLFMLNLKHWKVVPLLQKELVGVAMKLKLPYYAIGR